jgi:hypothetical protein
VRQLVRGGTIKETEKKVAEAKRRGWKPITDIKMDDSQATYNIVSYVCVMELKEKPHGTRDWGRRGFWM